MRVCLHRRGVFTIMALKLSRVGASPHKVRDSPSSNVQKASTNGSLVAFSWTSSIVGDYLKE